MRKMTYIGIIILVIAVAAIALGVFYGSSGIIKAASGLVVMKNMTVFNNSFAYLTFNTVGTPLIFSARSESDVNFYLMNMTAYSLWAGANYTGMHQNRFLVGEGLEGNGIIVVYHNTMNASFPASIGQEPMYIEGGNSTYANLANSTYYLVIDNTNGSASNSTNVNVSVVYLPNINTNNATTYSNYTNFEDSLNRIRAETEVAFVLLIIGVVVIIYSLVRGRRGKGIDGPKIRVTSDEDIDNLYEKAGVRGKGVQTGGRAARRKSRHKKSER